MNAPRPQHAQTSLSSGMVWNLASLGFLALAGLFLNFAIARVYGEDALGVFNVAFALYIFASQIGTFGIHFSVLQSVSALMGRDQDALDQSATSALAATLIASTLTTVLSIALIPAAVVIYGDKVPGIGAAVAFILPGLWAFSINKTLYSIINGARHMRTFAVLQAARYALMLGSFCIFSIWKIPAPWLTVVFSITELLLLPVLFLFASRVVQRWDTTEIKSGVRRHFSFGSRIFLSGAALELNTRVDVLMLAFYIDGAAAGLYTIAALVAEGASQAIFAVRNNFNPIIANVRSDEEKSALLSLSRRSVLFMTPFMGAISVLAYFIYPVFCRVMFGNDTYLAAHDALMFLLIGLTLSSGLLTFSMIFSQVARPAYHTLFVFGNLAVNIVLNAVLIPILGVTGAAMATAISFVSSAILLVVLSRLVLGVRLLV
jgi:O-antigen/teichoic acid export membrane protein